MRKSKLSHEAKQAFIDAILAVCREHKMTLKHYYVEYDEYDSDEGMEIEPLDKDEFNLFYIKRAL